MTDSSQQAPSVDDLACHGSRFLRNYLAANGESMARI